MLKPFLVAAMLIIAIGLHLIGLLKTTYLYNHIVWQLRVPRLLAGICVGAILGQLVLPIKPSLEIA